MLRDHHPTRNYQLGNRYHSFKNTFAIQHPNIRLAGVNLRLSSQTNTESHTTAFHRDYNSYYTVKIFLPLSELKYPI